MTLRDATPQRRAAYRIGVLVPFTNTNLEADMALLTPNDVSFHVARLGGYDAQAIPDSAQMAGLGATALDEPLTLIEGVQPDVVLYGCTSATLAHGPAFDADLASNVKQRSGAAAITAAGALVHAIKTLKVARIAFASPYVEELNDRAIGFLKSCDIDCVSRADWPEQLGNDEQGAITPDQVIDLAHEADNDEAQAIVLSCTDMRSVEVVDILEQRLNKPVIASNQAMMFCALQLLGLQQSTFRCGRLLRLLSDEPQIEQG